MSIGINGATGDCNTCDWWRRKGSKKKGVRIEGGRFGKCLRPQGPCEPHTHRRGIGESPCALKET
jgi:hypothetical protein